MPLQALPDHFLPGQIFKLEDGTITEPIIPENINAHVAKIRFRYESAYTGVIMQSIYVRHGQSTGGRFRLVGMLEQEPYTEREKLLIRTIVNLSADGACDAETINLLQHAAASN